jgi:transcriptional regulator with XRE-family HTH domain
MTKLLERLKSKEYRDAYVAEHVKRGISYQIRALRDQRQWSQSDLSQKLGKAQSVVSRIEDPNYGKFTVQTLLEVAAAFDVALLVRFAPISEMLDIVRDVSPAALEVAPYQGDQMKDSIQMLDCKIVSLGEWRKKHKKYGTIIGQSVATDMLSNEIIAHTYTSTGPKKRALQ